jgi:hypothetical protein
VTVSGSPTLAMTGAFMVSSGSFTSGSGTVTAGSTVISGGSFTGGGTGSLSLGAVTLSAGTFTSSGSGAVSATTFTISDGTASMTGAATLTTTGDFALSAGTFTANTGTVTVGGNLTVTGGTFTSGTGSVAVTGNVNVSRSSSSGVDTSLVGYWAFEETASPSADSSGNGNTATWSGTPTSTTSHAPVNFTDTRSLAMTGTQYAATAALSGIAELRPTAVTMSAWYKANSVDTNGGEIVSGANVYGLRITNTGLSVMKRIANNGTPTQDWVEYRVTPTGYLDGTWHQIVGIVDSTGEMSAYFDGSPIAGSYYYNGTSGVNAVSNQPELSAINYAGITTYGLNIGRNPSTNGYDFGTGCTGTNCAIDEVRVYNRALTAAQVVALSNGNLPGGATGILSLSGTLNVTGNATVQGTGSLTMASGSTLAIGDGKTLTIDGTLNATGGTIKKLSGTSYTFKVGSSMTATPDLNITALAVQNTDGSGMQINTVTGSTTTFTNFDNLAFSAIGVTGAGTQYLQISASPLYLVANGLSFGVGDTTIPAAAVKLTDSAATDTYGARLVLGGATCATAKTDATTSLCLTTWKSDGDADENGYVTTTSADGAVIQFIRSSPTDTAGTIEGFPTAAFDWNTFAYYSTYVTFHDVTGSVDTVYVRSQTGTAKYSWSTPSGETIVGTPRYVTSGTTHYVFVATNGTTTDSGRIYRLKDSGSTLALDLSGNWSSRNPFSCTCTIKTQPGTDATNLYWGGTTGGAQRVWRLAQALATATPFGLSNVAITPTVTSVTPAQMTLGTTVYMFLGMASHVLKVDVTNMTTVTDNTAVGTATVYGRIGTTTGKLFVGDDAGKMRALDPTTFSNTPLWLYNGTDSIKSSSYYDSTNAVLMFGTETGKVVALNSTGAVISASYPMTPDSSTGAIRSALLYSNGIMAAGTTTGKLYFIDRSAATLVRKYDFGASESVSGIGYDANVNRYMVTTSDTATEDGRIYYIDRITDPTASAP